MRLFMIRQTGNTVTLFNPSGAIAGELFNARMLILEGVEVRDAYKSVLLMHGLMILSQLSLFAVVLVRFMFFHSDELSPRMRLAADICFPALLFAVSGLAFLLLGKRKETGEGKKRWKVISRIEEMRFLLAAHVRIHPCRTATAFLLFSAQWMLGSLELFFILHFLNNPVDVWDGLFLDTLIIILKSTAAFIPGQLGVEELANKFTLHLFGISSPGLWLPVSILRRARQVFWSGMSLLFYVRLKGWKISR
ncbi:MAG: flippase-like domain-containing protein [Tannerella sp.]|nr:flippase-like domain-containing protein [Tannerella sp.]